MNQPPVDAIPAELVTAVPPGTQKAVLGYVGPGSEDYAVPSTDKVLELTSTTRAMPGKAASIRHWCGETALRVTKIEPGDALTEVRRVVAGVSVVYDAKKGKTLEESVGPSGFTAPLKHILAFVLVNRGEEERELNVRITCRPTSGGVRVDPSPGTRGARPVPNRPLAGVVRRGVPSPKPKPAKKAAPPIIARNQVRHGGPRKDPMVPSRPKTQPVTAPTLHAEQILSAAGEGEPSILLALGRYEAEQIVKLLTHGAPLQTRPKVEHALRAAKQSPVAWSDEKADLVNRSRAAEVAVKTTPSIVAACLALCHGAGHALRGTEAGQRFADDVAKALAPSQVLTVQAEEPAVEEAT